MKNYKPEEIEKIIYLYVVEKLSFASISKLFKCDPTTIRGIIKRNNICIRTRSEAMKDKPKSQEHKDQIAGVLKHTRLSKAHKKKISGALKGEKSPMYGKRGEDSPSYQGGKPWKSGYNYEFDIGTSSGKALQTYILTRDNWQCQACGQSCERKRHKFLRHHIDYNKENNNPLNLIVLCSKCHTKVHKLKDKFVYKFARREIIGKERNEQT